MNHDAAQGFTAAELKHFAADGYVVAPHLIGLDTCGHILEIAQRDLATAKPPVEYEADTRYPGAPPDYDAPGGRTVRRLLQAYSRDEAISAVATGQPIGARLKQLLGPQVVLAQAHHNCIMTKNPRYSSLTGWHQDIRYWSFQRPELISVWIALGREYYENGCLLAIPGSHNIAFTAEQLDAELFLREYQQRNQSLIATRHRIELAAGDVLFFHCRLLHSAGHNQTLDTKFSLVFTYHAVGNQPLPGSRSAELPEIALNDA